VGGEELQSDLEHADPTLERPRERLRAIDVRDVERHDDGVLGSRDHADSSPLPVQCPCAYSLPRSRPRRSAADANPVVLRWRWIPCAISAGADGFTSIAVPTCTAQAPAKRNSTASSPVPIPPTPMIGTSG